MSLARQQPRVEPAEREDPRNVLLDEICSQIVAGLDAARRNDVLTPLLARIESQAPALGAIFARAQAAVPATVVHVPPSPAAVAVADEATIEAAMRSAPLGIAAVLTALKVASGFRMSSAHRASIENAKAVVLGWMTGGRGPAAPSVPLPVLPATIGAWTFDAGSGA